MCGNKPPKSSHSKSGAYSRLLSIEALVVLQQMGPLWPWVGSRAGRQAGPLPHLLAQAGSLVAPVPQQFLPGAAWPHDLAPPQPGSARTSVHGCHHCSSRTYGNSARRADRSTFHGGSQGWRTVGPLLPTLALEPALLQEMVWSQDLALPLELTQASALL